MSDMSASGRESRRRHLWVGGLPDEIDEAGIQEYFSKFGQVEGVKILPQRYPNLGVAAFVDFFDVRSAIEAKEAKLKLNGCELRTNFKSKQPVSTGTGWFERNEGSAEKEKAEKSRDIESSSSSSGRGSESSSSSSSSSESEDEGKEGKTKVKKKRGTEGSVGATFLKVTGLATRPERVLQDGLYYEFTRHCPSAVVKMYGDSPEKLHAIVKFNTAEECKSAHEKAQGLSLFGNKIKLTFLDKEDFPGGGRDAPFLSGGPGGGHPPGGRGPPPVGGPGYLPDDLDPQATRSLFVGNITKNISVYELRDIFQRYGNVLDVEIKKMSGSATYGFVLFDDLMNAVTAKHYMDGQNIRGNNIRVGFGKGTPSKTLWVDGIDTVMSEAQMERHLSKYGTVTRLGIDRSRGCCMAQYESMDEAKEAVLAVKGTFIGNSKRLMTDFANRDARAAFFSRIEGGGGGGDLPPPRGFPPPGPGAGGPGGMYGPGGMGPRGRGGMMMPRPGMHMMGMGRGGFPPPGHGPPMDYYYPPYMDEGMYYGGGGRPPFHGPGGIPMGMRRFPRGGHRHHHHPYEEGFDEYEEELRAFTRKREWEREREKRREGKKRRGDSSNESEDSESDNESSTKRRKSGRDKDKERHKKASKKEKTTGKSEGETGSEEEDEAKREELRLRSTQKSRDLREKLKKARKRKERELQVKSDDGEASSESGEEEEVAERKKSRKEKAKEKTKPTEKEEKKERTKPRDKDKERERERGKEKSRSSKKDIGDERKSSKKRLTRTPPGLPPVESDSKTTERKPVKEREKDNAEIDKTKTRESKQKAKDTKDTEAKTSPVPPRNGEHSKETRGQQSKSKSSTPMPQQDEDLEQHPGKLEETQVKAVERMDTGELEGDVETTGVADTPLSPPPDKKGVESKLLLLGAKGSLESDLSSGEDFKESESEAFTVEGAKPGEETEYLKERESEKQSALDVKEVQRSVPERPVEPPEGKSRKPEAIERAKKLRSPGFRSPDVEPNGSECRPSSPPYPPPSGSHLASGRKPSMSEESEGGKASDSEVGRKAKKLPRRYQLEEEERKDKHVESKDLRHLRKPYPPPTSPSPPPAFVSHRRRHHSPPPHEHFERRWLRRGRPYSPAIGHRRHSRSPPPPGYLPSSPPHRPRSPYSNSPPPRPRTPIQRPGRERSGPRHRYDSPPPPSYDPSRAKYPRRGSPPSRHFTPSPPPRSRSPGRRFPRHRTPSPSPPSRRSPIRRRERSHSTESGPSSPRYPEDRFDRYRHGKRPGYSRTPSPPRPKHREPPPKEDYPEPKRRRVEDPRPKSPLGTPPPSKEETRISKSEKSMPAPLSGSSGSKPSRMEGKVKGHERGGGEGGQYGGQQLGAKGGQKAPVAVPQGQQSHYHGHGQHSTQGPAHSHAPSQQASAPVAQQQQQQQADNLLDLLRRYPVMWQGHLMLKNDSAAVQLHFLSGNVNLAKLSLPQAAEQRTPTLRIAQRMRLEQTQLEGVERRIQQNDTEHCLLLALPCGRDANDVRAQTHALKNNLISYLLQKQAAGIINIQGPHAGFVLHIFPPCPFSQSHLSRVAPDLLSSASDNCHLMIVIATM